VFWRKLFGGSKDSDPAYSIPEGERVYAIGDVHGRADLLVKLCEMIKADIAGAVPAKTTVIFLGDYIDRGFHSREVIEYLINLEISGAELVFLAGNHEDMMSRFFTDPAECQLWLGVGGIAALASYGVFLRDDSDIEDMLQASTELLKAMPTSHRDFLLQLGEHYQVGEYLFVHAGLRPGVPLTAQRRSDKLSIRRQFTESDFDFGLRVVHGHSGVKKPVTTKNRIAIDTGAFATGVLTAAVIESDHVRFLNT
jgi:serine/threonine protein phosphatase 1